jgi:3-hydroxyisobutyrate dehydrogenase
MVFRGQFEPPSFALSLARKDILLANELGREFNVPMPIANLAEQIAIQGMNRGWGDMDSSATFMLQEEASGVQVRAPHIDADRAARFISTHPDAS